jgi:uncharacterized phiE125 gp8 family phage protein
MFYPPSITTPPGSEPITLADAKIWGRFDTSDDDTRITGALTAARAYVESFTGTYLIAQTVTIKCDKFSDAVNSIPLAPVASISSITYVDTSGNSQTLSTDIYEVRTDGLETALALKFGQVWPSTQDGSRITIVAGCGYATGTIPPPVLQAIRLLTIAEVDGARDGATSAAVDMLLANYRRSN